MNLAMNPKNTGYSVIALCGEFFSFDIGNSTDYITFFVKENNSRHRYTWMDCESGNCWNQPYLINSVDF